MPIHEDCPGVVREYVIVTATMRVRRSSRRQMVQELVRALRDGRADVRTVKDTPEWRNSA